jgi:hypothetical protein
LSADAVRKIKFITRSDAQEFINKDQLLVLMEYGNVIKQTFTLNKFLCIILSTPKYIEIVHVKRCIKVKFYSKYCEA